VPSRRGPKGTGPLPFGADGPGRTNVLSLAGSVLPAGVALPLTVFLAEMCVVTLSRPAHRPGHGRPCRRRESCATIGLTCRAGQGRASKGQDQERKGSRGNAQHPRPPVLRGRTGPGGNGREGVRIRHIGGGRPGPGGVPWAGAPDGERDAGAVVQKKTAVVGVLCRGEGAAAGFPPVRYGSCRREAKPGVDTGTPTRKRRRGSTVAQQHAPGGEVLQRQLMRDLALECWA
jgi:hypothetical protein